MTRYKHKWEDPTRLYSRVCRRCNEIHKTYAKASGALCEDCRKRPSKYNRRVTLIERLNIQI